MQLPHKDTCLKQDKFVSFEKKTLRFKCKEQKLFLLFSRPGSRNKINESEMSLCYIFGSALQKQDDNCDVHRPWIDFIIIRKEEENNVGWWYFCISCGFSHNLHVYAREPVLITRKFL